MGKVTPLVCGLKLDLHDLTTRKLDWDDVIPDNLRNIWSSNIEMIQEIRNIRYNRAVVPHDAVDLNMETIDCADASQSMICVAIYVRFLRKSGDFSCQLLFSRSKIIPDDMSVPRAELLASSMNASTGHVVKTALGERHMRAWKLTDSQVSMHWINCFRSKLKMFVRNLVINILRLSSVDDWRHVDSENMPADIGTRKGLKIDDVGPDSVWINGFPWMAGESSKFPVRTISEIILTNEGKRDAQKEQIILDTFEANTLSYNHVVPHVVKDRYSFSKYLIDPFKFRFKKVVRIVAWVLMFLKRCLEPLGRRLNLLENVDMRSDLNAFVHPDGATVVTHSFHSLGPLRCPDGLSVDMSMGSLEGALRYFFLKATLEIKQFLPASAYLKISKEKDDILYYTGRILPSQKVTGSLTLGDVSFDLTQATFCVPLVERNSPIAYSIINEIHWYHSDVWHAGVESVLREVGIMAHVIGGRHLVKTIKQSGTKCRILEKATIEVAMGPKDSSQLCIAPAFYNTQVDLCGPFDYIPDGNKRATLKLWFSVFCCSTTGATDIKVMMDYTTDAFVLAFIRFACRYGFPGNLYPDAGSQLLKGAKDMTLKFSDIKNQLFVEYGVNFHPCPVGSHYYHGKVERRIREIRRSIEKLSGERLSMIQWETLGQQIANSINNLPIGLGNKCEMLENLDLLTPNRLILGRNNNRCPTAPLVLSNDVRRIVETNNDIFTAWFSAWLTSYVPTLIPQPKWFKTNRDVSVGDVVLFSKSDKEFDNSYQYGIIKVVNVSKDGLIRSVEVEYQNFNEKTKRTTRRGVREIIVIHPFGELSLSKELYDLAAEADQDLQADVCHCIY